MSKRKDNAQPDPQKHEKYTTARAEAQRLANEAARATPDYALKGGCDYRLEYNELFKSYSFGRLPLPQNRYGFELRCEVVMPEINRFETEEPVKHERREEPTGDFYIDENRRGYVYDGRR